MFYKDLKIISDDEKFNFTIISELHDNVEDSFHHVSHLIPKHREQIVYPYIIHEIHKALILSVNRRGSIAVVFNRCLLDLQGNQRKTVGIVSNLHVTKRLRFGSANY